MCGRRRQTGHVLQGGAQERAAPVAGGRATRYSAQPDDAVGADARARTQLQSRLAAGQVLDGSTGIHDEFDCGAGERESDRTCHILVRLSELSVVLGE